MAEGLFVSYIFPPLLGAAIGYLTNSVAIRMLFRPLEPWRVFGWRVPLTPGIIPAKRKLLAEKIGKMVGEHLLTSEDVIESLEKESFLKEFRAAVGLKLDQWLHQDIGKMEDRIADDHREHLRHFLSTLNFELTQTVFTYLGTREFQDILAEFLRRKKDDLLSRDLESILDHLSLDRLENYFNERLDDWLRSDHFDSFLERNIESRIDQLLETDKPLREILPDKLVTLVFDQIDRSIPNLLERCSRHLYTPALRRELTYKTQTTIKKFMDSLGGVSGFFAGFINLDKINAKIPEFLDHTGTELSAWLQEEETRTKLSQLIQDNILEFLYHSPKDLLQKLPYEKVAEVRQIIHRQILEMGRGPQWRDHLSTLLKSSFRRVKDRSLRGLLEKWVPDEGLEEVQNHIARSIVEGLQAEQVKGTFSTLLLENFENWLMKQPAGKLSDYIPVTVRDWIEESIYRYMVEVAQKEIPVFVESFNVRERVREKVDSLDILAVEGLLLGIMQEHFVYINLFGALLGFIIGLLNVVI